MINLDRFSRVTSSRSFIPEIDGLRFVAISSVVLYHLRTNVLRTGEFSEASLAGNPVFGILTQGGLGVNLFFTISGFILALPFAKYYFNGQQGVDLPKYYMRRLTRLEPPYIIIMTILFVGLSLSGSFYDLFPHYLASLGYVHYFVYGEWSVINPVAWSLETEVQFYILAPLVATIFIVRDHKARYAAYLGVIVLHVMFLSTYTRWMADYHLTRSILYFFSNFFLGFALADVFLRCNILSEGTRNAFNDVLGASGMAGMYLTYLDPRPTSMFLFHLSTAFLFLGAFRGRWLNLILSYKPVTVIGGMCYTIYLIHYALIHVVWGSLYKWISSLLPSQFFGQYAFAMILVLPILLVVSALVFITIERPFMYPDWVQRLTNKFAK